MRKNAFLSVGVSAVALTLLSVSPALAQSTDQADPATEEQAQDPGEIVVMAQGRAQVLAALSGAKPAAEAGAKTGTTANVHHHPSMQPVQRGPAV